MHNARRGDARRPERPTARPAGRRVIRHQGDDIHGRHSDAESVTMIAYVRRSKADRRKREQEGHGIAAQKAAIRREAEHRGWQLVWAPEDDNRTGANTNREGLTWALNELDEGRADGLVVAKLDRLSRSLLDFATLAQLATRQGWAIVSLDPSMDLSTPHGRLVANILVAFAEWERLMIAQRTREALAAAKEAGVRLGRPSGVDPETVAAIVRLRDAGCTLESIADVLNDQQIPTAQGGQRWRVSTIRGVLTRTYERMLNDESTNTDARLIA